MTAISLSEFMNIITLLLSQVTAFANILDSSYVISGWTWLDMLVSIVYIEVTFDFILALAYGDYIKEY